MYNSSTVISTDNIIFQDVAGDSVNKIIHSYVIVLKVDFHNTNKR